jgi:hypothetical protein
MPKRFGQPENSLAAFRREGLPMAAEAPAAVTAPRKNLREIPFEAA